VIIPSSTKFGACLHAGQISYLTGNRYRAGAKRRRGSCYVYTEPVRSAAGYLLRGYRAEVLATAKWLRKAYYHKAIKINMEVESCACKDNIGMSGL
jgi:hypothetical protein